MNAELARLVVRAVHPTAASAYLGERSAMVYVDCDDCNFNVLGEAMGDGVDVVDLAWIDAAERIEALK